MKISLKDMPNQDTILIYGRPKIGKSFSYMSAIKRCIDAGGEVFIINTDGGVKTTMMAFFKEDFEKYAELINHYFITDINETEEVVKDIKGKIQPSDLIVIDLISDFWEMAQQKFIDNLSGGKTADYIERASRDKSKFGLLSGQQWQYVKKLDNLLMAEFVVKPICKVIAVAGSKQLDMDKVHNNKEILDRYDAVGEKPEGQRQLQYKFSTIVYIGEYSGKRFFKVLGDRGRNATGTSVEFDKDFYGSLMNWRKKNEGI